MEPSKALTALGRAEMQAEEFPYRIDRFNNGRHWRVEVDGRAFDFWPCTGTWQNPRNHQQRGSSFDFDHFVQTVARLHDGGGV